MRLPNGYGSVYKLSGNRRKPYVARKTINFYTDDITGKTVQQRGIIGYYATREQALQALAEYNAVPYDLSGSTLTFAEVYDLWFTEYAKTASKGAQRTIAAAYKHCKPLYKLKMRDIRAGHLERTMMDADVGTPTKQRIKSMYNLMYKYAMKYDIVQKDYSAVISRPASDGPKIERKGYTAQEIKMLFDGLEFPFTDMLLIGIFTGFRPQELAILKVDDIDLDEWTIKGGLKTDAGRNRIVPIHSAIRSLVEARLIHAKSLGSTSLFNYVERAVSFNYDAYRHKHDALKKHYNLDHTMHDTRHTFITMAKEAGVNEYCLKLMVGHTIQDVTEKVYTHRKISELKQEIEKIKAPI